MKERIAQLADKYLEKIMELRRELHKIPELGFEEFKTAEVVKRELTKLGIPYQDKIAKTGIVGIIKGGKPGKTVLLRADMDALPIQEESRHPFRSEHPGKMHACGHDGHTAGLLGAAMILNELKGELAGTVKLLFQPAEEGPGGAKPMVEAGILENPNVDAAFACHIWPAYPAGKVGIRDGYMMSHPTGFDILIQGVGGHGSQPEKTVDPVVIGCQVVTNFQNIISRRKSTFLPAVLSVGSIHAGEANNVIPDTLTMKGTIRTFDEGLTDEILKQMDAILKGITEAYGATYKFNYTHMYPAVKNDHAMYEFCKEVLTEVVGEENVVVMDEPIMGSEDFSYIGNVVPSNYYVVGVRDEGQDIESMNHHPKLFWNEKHLRVNAWSLALLAATFLGE
ncbi:MAG: amidohydrolase [Fusobacteriaceae bacterium]|jgi:amidohydrolase|nr:amidohydrolase [Fusobacteriaceae bacterium]